MIIRFGFIIAVVGKIFVDPAGATTEATTETETETETEKETETETEIRNINNNYYYKETETVTETVPDGDFDFIFGDLPGWANALIWAGVGVFVVSVPILVSIICCLMCKRKRKVRKQDSMSDEVDIAAAMTEIEILKKLDENL